MRYKININKANRDYLHSNTPIRRNNNTLTCYVYLFKSDIIKNQKNYLI